MKPAFHLMAKPTSYTCNIDCVYCFYQGKDSGTLSQKTPSRFMSDDVLENYIKKYIIQNPTQLVEFAWQGGEPTMAGIDFYQKALSLQKKYANGKKITNTLQTNGILIDDNWGEFLSKNNFLVGISLDGTKHIHDRYRKTHAGKSTHDKVVNAVRILQKYNVEFNVLIVVNEYTAKYPLEVYKYLTQEVKANYLQFIPSVDRRPQGVFQGELISPNLETLAYVTPWSVTGPLYASFINSIFDYWFKNDIGSVFVQIFENTLVAVMGQSPGMCVMRATCGLSLVIEQNGDIYSCDHFVYPEYKLGNILTDNLTDLVYSKKQKNFGMSKSDFSKVCLECDYRFVCQGGCPKLRINSINGKAHNYLCEGYKSIFKHSIPPMKTLAALLQQGHSIQEIRQITPLMIL
ncbi:anaerobic sulfatase maturase [Providencia rettgeri]|uniref:Anaerobic sulfatase maturase n=1 Tax=Providencia rettgeri TaxID=587 RepID=A0AAE2ZG04_PRORE|nr:anaerobic sulfatase maturase [Providencia rettgeri]MBW3117411.1 anaerobic sulfatase maturase [Providencia rettgeri]NHN53590.1 anaerobic sulfatase maturase [Providencia rettgeri]